MQQLAALADMCQRTKPAPGKAVYYNTCPRCGKQDAFEMEVPSFAINILTGGNTQNFCDDCAKEIKRLDDMRREQQHREQLLEKADIPADFLEWDRTKGDNQLARLVHENADKCLFVCGKNAACKTRATAVNLKLQIVNNNTVGRFIRWSDLALGYARICKLSSENSKFYIDDFLKYDILLIDDIGKRRITETAGEMLYDMIDLVYSGEKKTKLWITSNKTLEDLSECFENLDIGDAVISRIDRMVESGKMMKIETGK